MEKITLFWFRRDLRLEDNTGLFYALQQEKNVLPLFIFDRTILDKLEDKADARVEFIHSQLIEIKSQLEKKGSTLLIKYGKPEEIYVALLNEYDIQAVYTNRDYEPYAKERDAKIETILKEKGISLFSFKDQLIFEPGEILNGSGDFYKVFTPFSRNWLDKYHHTKVQTLEAPNWKNLHFVDSLKAISLKEMGFEETNIQIPPKVADQDIIRHYDKTRNYPAQNGTSRLGIHLRFGTISIRKLVQIAASLNETYLNELIWREFYMMILAYNPQVVERAFKPAYDQIPWRNNTEDFQAWCEGNTGYPIVDAGMRELNATGYMHNRVRMVVASFLTKHLLIDWKWGEAYFAKKLLDFELASNNGGWQWAAGTGTDAQPYFRVFNPDSQTEKFDKELKYIKKWIPELGTSKYPKPIVDHKFARVRAIETYKQALNQ
ncbi:cryptochrome/photolyase family protein [Algoriphagus boritolerans]|uniref:Deoxyribodipyrimidine photo-lyase n=1 Tax=Algoriphagus boritolerans DSM 17298 = JCM 18970 TaxID=1120964 RepID=A0A1H5ZUZ2_9BACT|nr:deoxyribodipyrimidine photo-lyase [Algoriphagus boritolerans]SEG39246.1 deoxyribodipyrimidine photo-lyase [Algoriphagus boritolerans DSM 17298 = JCM 18970]